MFFLLLIVVALQTADSDVATFSSYIRGERWDFNISLDALNETAPWPDPELSPPLPPRRAIQIAAEHFRQLITDAERWHLKSVSLRPVWDQEHWVYLVEFEEPPPRGDGGIHSSLTFVVLMNGNSIMPTRSAWP
jgi:hypothetical protein